MKTLIAYAQAAVIIGWRCSVTAGILLAVFSLYYAWSI